MIKTIFGFLCGLLFIMMTSSTSQVQDSQFVQRAPMKPKKVAVVRADQSGWKTYVNNGYIIKCSYESYNVPYFVMEKY